LRGGEKQTHTHENDFDGVFLATALMADWCKIATVYFTLKKKVEHPPLLFGADGWIPAVHYPPHPHTFFPDKS
jgi:hypothetical protein